MYNNGAVEEEILYIDASDGGIGDSIKFQYTIDATETLSMAKIQLNGEGDQYSCTYTIENGLGTPLCKFKYSAVWKELHLVFCTF